MESMSARESSTIKFRRYLESLTVYDLHRELSVWQFYIKHNPEYTERFTEEKIEPILFELRRIGYKGDNHESLESSSV